MKRIIKTALILGSASLLFSCMKESSEPIIDFAEREDIILTRSQSDFVNNNQEFAFELFKEVSESKGFNESFIISPLSVTIALGMVTNGAEGETRKEINETLGYKDESLEELNNFCNTMLTELPKVDPSTAIEFADMALINSLRTPLKDNFSKLLENDYSANVVYKNFGEDNIMPYVNKWCEDHTHGMITNFLKSEPNIWDYAHFLNATYFKGIWSSGFKKKDTKKQSFYLENGSKADVEMMHQKGNFKYISIPDRASAVCLPFGNKAFSMTFLLPEEGLSVEQFCLSLDSDLWEKIVKDKQERVVDVMIPSFESEYGTEDIRKILEDMGIVRAFDPRMADFSEMTDQIGVAIQGVLHKAKITVNEDGSKAAAVTDVYMAASTGIGGHARPAPEIVFHADRPFIYAITEVSTGAILFIGQYTGKE